MRCVMHAGGRHLQSSWHEIGRLDRLAAEAQQAHAQRRRPRRALLRRRLVLSGPSDHLKEARQEVFGLQVDAWLDAIQGAPPLQNAVGGPRHLHAYPLWRAGIREITPFLERCCGEIDVERQTFTIYASYLAEYWWRAQSHADTARCIACYCCTRGFRSSLEMVKTK